VALTSKLHYLWCGVITDWRLPAVKYARYEKSPLVVSMLRQAQQPQAQRPLQQGFYLKKRFKIISNGYLIPKFAVEK